MRKPIALLVFPLLCCSGLLAQQGQGNNGKETTVIRGKVMGFSSVSPALTKELDAKSGNKPAAPPKGPHVFVGKHGFAYVSPHAEGKKK